MLLVCAFALAAARAQDARSLVFDPAPGTRVGKSIRVEHALDTIALGIVAGDQVKELPRVRLLTSEDLAVDDEYRASASGRPTSLRRVYREIFHDLRALAPGNDEPVSHFSATSPLTSSSVLFTWVPGENAYGRFYDAQEGIEESLAGLTEDLDARELLPPRAVRIGERWEIEPARLRELLAAGGKVPLNWVPEPDDPVLRNVACGIGGALFEVFGDVVNGKVTAELAAITREEGSELARVDVTIDLDTARDQTELLRNRMTRLEVVRGSVVTGARITFRLHAHGKLTWNLTQRRLHAFELDGTEEVDREIDIGGGRDKGGQTEQLQLKGAMKLSISVGAPRASEIVPAGEGLPHEPEPDGGGGGGGGGGN